MAVEMPEVIQRYQKSHDGHDVEGALAAFSADATVHDEGQKRAIYEGNVTRLLRLQTAGAGG